MIKGASWLVRGVVGAALLAGGAGAFAGSVMGTGGGTEVTQLLNNFELVTQNATALDKYVRQGLQLDTQLRNLAQNPAALMGPEAGALMHAVGTLIDAGNGIGSSMAQIDQRLGQRYANTQAMTFSQRFQSWTDGSRGNLAASMRAAGLRRDQYRSDSAALDALLAQSQNADGAAAAAQAAAAINIQNVRQLQALGDMLAEQHTAQAEYKIAALDKEQDKQNNVNALAVPLSGPVPDMTNQTSPSRWGTILFH